METDTRIQHVAVECASQQQADTFFVKVLGMPKVKTTMLPKELCASIFDIGTPVQMETYDNGTARVEVFLREDQKIRSFVHIGMAVENTADFITRCEAEGLKPFFVQKAGKQLLFVRDFSHNLYEIVTA